MLDGKKIVVTEDVLVWGNWFETANRIIKQETLPDGKFVSTVFLGLDYSFGMNKAPILFETMVFLGKELGSELDMDRYSTYEEAQLGHQAMVSKWLKRQ